MANGVMTLWKLKGYLSSTEHRCNKEKDLYLPIQKMVNREFVRGWDVAREQKRRS